MKKIKFLASLLIIALILSACGSPAQTTQTQTNQTAQEPANESAAKEKYVLKLAHAYQSTTLHHQTMEWFNEELQKRSNGRLSLEIYPGAMLMPGDQEIPGVLQGQIDMTHSVSTFVATIDPIWGVFDLPFIFEYDPENPVVYLESRNKFADDPNTGELLAKSLEEKGLKLITFNAVDYFAGIGMADSEDIIRVPEDLRGKKIRTTGGKVVSNTLSKLGATGIPVPGVEVPTALQQGLVDGLVSAPIFVNDNKYAIKTFTLLQMTNLNTPLVMSLEKFNSLPKDLQDILIETGRDLRAYSNKLIEERTLAAIENMKSRGVEVYYPTAEEIEKWKELTRSVWDDFVKDVPEAKELIENIKKSNP